MAKKITSKPITPHQKGKREDFQKKLHDLCNSTTEKDKENFPLTQAQLAKEFFMSQSDISRILKGFEIDWETGDLIPKAESTNLLKLLQKTSITRPSTFFLSVTRLRSKKLKEALLQHFPSTESQPGIIHIIEIKSPSGLLIFSDDHNLEYNLTDMDYLKTVIENANFKKADASNNPPTD